MKIYANNKNTVLNITFKADNEEGAIKKEPDFFVVQEVLEREISTPIITNTWEEALDTVYDLIKQALDKELGEGGDYEDCDTRDKLFDSMRQDGALTLITGNYIYYFTAYGETSNHDNIDWKISPIYAEIN